MVGIVVSADIAVAIVVIARVRAIVISRHNPTNSPECTTTTPDIALTGWGNPSVEIGFV